MSLDHHEGTYLKLAVKRYAPRTLRETAEGRYWRAYKSPALIHQVSQVTSVAFAASRPHELAVTSSARVTVFDARSRRPTRTFARFKDVAYSGVLRDDGRALAVGGQQGWVQLFDCHSRAVLRKFQTHRRAVRSVRFSPHSHGVIASASDDTTVRLWDVASGECATRFDGHVDYARSVAGHPASADAWASGGYDGTVRVWDARAPSSNGSNGARMVLDHGAPVEDVAWLPSGSLLVSVGGQDLCVWDVLSGGRLLRRKRCHQKTVMCVHASRDGGPPPVFDEHEHLRRSAVDRTAPRILTGSLDGHVKVHELDAFGTTHSAKYPGPVMSVALSPDAETLAVGTANKFLSVRRRSKPRATLLGGDDESSRSQRHRGGATWGVPTGSGGFVARSGNRYGGRKGGPRRLDAGSWQYFIRGQDAKAAEGDYQVQRLRRVRLKAHDKALRRFRYGEALDAALAGGRSETVAAVLEELARRGGLRTALAGRDAGGLAPVLAFAARHVANPRHTKQLAGVVRRVLDVYGGEVGASDAVDEMLRKVRDAVAERFELNQKLAELAGMSAPLLAAGV